MRYTINYKIDFKSLPHRGKFLKWDDMVSMNVNFFNSDKKEDCFLIIAIEPNPTRSKLKIYTNYHGYNSYISQNIF